MAAVSGKQGLVSYKGSAVDSLNDAGFDVDVDMRDHTSFSTGSVFFRTMKPGLAGGTATVSGFWDSASTDQKDMIDAVLAGSTGSIKVEMDKDTGGGLSANSYFNSLSLAASIDGDSTVNFGVTANGTVTYSTTT